MGEKGFRALTESHEGSGLDTARFSDHHFEMGVRGFDGGVCGLDELSEESDGSECVSGGMRGGRGERGERGDPSVKTRCRPRRGKSKTLQGRHEEVSLAHRTPWEVWEV